MMPTASASPVMQAAWGLPVRVKNTFLECCDCCDDEEYVGRAANRRGFFTCPDFPKDSEPEMELSPLQPLAAPQSGGGSHDSPGAGSPAEPAPEASPMSSPPQAAAVGCSAIAVAAVPSIPEGVSLVAFQSLLEWMHSPGADAGRSCDSPLEEEEPQCGSNATPMGLALAASPGAALGLCYDEWRPMGGDLLHDQLRDEDMSLSPSRSRCRRASGSSNNSIGHVKSSDRLMPPEPSPWHKWKGTAEAAATTSVITLAIPQDPLPDGESTRRRRRRGGRKGKGGQCSEEAPPAALPIVKRTTSEEVAASPSIRTTVERTARKEVATEPAVRPSAERTTRKEVAVSPAQPIAERTTRKVVDASKETPGPSALCSSSSKATGKLWCHFYLDPVMLMKGFDLNKKIIGHGGSCTKGIFDATACKIRLRGRGSMHMEGPGNREAPVHLMLAVTTEPGRHESFRKAFDMSVELLKGVENRFRVFCRKSDHKAPSSPCFWVGELSSESRRSLGSALAGLTAPEAGRKH